MKEKHSSQKKILKNVLPKDTQLNELKLKLQQQKKETQQLKKNLVQLEKEQQRSKIEISTLEETLSAMEKIMEFSREQAIDLDKEIRARESLLDFAQMENIERNKEADAFANVLELSRAENMDRDSKLKMVKNQQQKSNEMIQLLMLQKNISSIVNSTLEMEEILIFLFDKLSKMFGFNKIIFEELDEANSQLKVMKVFIEGTPDEVLRGYQGKEIHLNLSEKGIAAKLMDMNSLYFFKEPYAHNREELLLEGFYAIYESQRIFLPILSQNQTIALLQMSLPSEICRIDDKQRELLESVISLITPAVKNAKLYQEISQKTAELEKKNKVIAKDLKMAQKLQTTYLSVNEKELEHLKVDIFFQPMIEVGGDIYDMSKVKAGYYRIFIADATGHGIQAALTTMILKTEYDKLKYFDFPPNMIIKYLNNVFIKNYYNLNIFFSCLVLDIDTENNLLYYSSAGHPDQYLMTREKVVPLQTGGKLVGIKDELQYQLKKFDFSPGDKLVLFTDGLFEEFSVKDELYGEERLIKLIQEYKDQPHHLFLKGILKEVKKWLGKNQVNDDITLIGIERVS